MAIRVITVIMVIMVIRDILVIRIIVVIMVIIAIRVITVINVITVILVIRVIVVIMVIMVIRDILVIRVIVVIMVIIVIRDILVIRVIVVIMVINVIRVFTGHPGHQGYLLRHHGLVFITWSSGLARGLALAELFWSSLVIFFANASRFNARCVGPYLAEHVSEVLVSTADTIIELWRLRSGEFEWVLDPEECNEIMTHICTAPM
ncbi:hypothetical protein CAPTEDRAFT_218136 [Capitella teleta]|uniref:Uncharacterized protein n=1 Tax=Capitella teleta TaxID=283909 RepID=R7THV4_CAPTE|nr:hypothetical protein CAPTEDRAFT_218136 [Capitella teleta]|eukprot:ELT93062.1 hypothetical protein CAPTEDRAFT_218136 [Capitella teleta]